MVTEAVGNRLDDRGAREHTRLGSVCTNILDHRVNLLCDQRRLDLLNAKHAPRVLRGDRGNHAGTIDPKRCERLQISLDTGTAARVRPRDRQCLRDPHVRRLRHLAFNAASTAWRRRRAAAATSSAPSTAEITATPSAPAAITGSALSASIAPIPTIGRSVCCRICASPAGPIGGPASAFVPVAYIGPTPR